jgi:hypothetical protein
MRNLTRGYLKKDARSFGACMRRRAQSTCEHRLYADTHQRAFSDGPLRRKDERRLSVIAAAEEMV